MGAAGARMHGMAHWLASFGHHVTVLTGMPNYPSGEIQPGYRNKLFMREMIDGVEVLRSWVYASPQRSPIHRMLNYLSFMGSSVINGVFHPRQADVLLVTSPPLFIGPSGWLLSRWYRCPWVLDIRDIWPDVVVNIGAFKRESLFVKSLDRLARFLYRRADHIVHVTENQRPTLRQAGVPEEKLFFVPNGMDFDLLENAPEINWREKLNLQNKFIVVYAGLIGVVHGVDIVVDTAMILQNDPDIHFLIVGDGVEKPKIVSATEQANLTNITFLDRQPREFIPSILASSDVAWNPIGTEHLVDVRPYKLLEAWGCNKPVLVSASGETAALVGKTGGGVAVPPNRPEELAEAILKLKENSEQLKIFGDNGYRYVKEHLDRQKIARTMEEILEALAQKG